MRLRQRQLSWQIKQFHHHTSLSLLSSLPSTSSSPYSQIEKARTVESANQRLPYSAVSTPASHWWGSHTDSYTLTHLQPQTHRLIHTYRLGDNHRHRHRYTRTNPKKLNNTHYHRMHPTDNIEQRLDGWLTSDEIPHTKPRTQPKRF